LIVVLPSTAEAGAWVRDAGDIYLKAGFSRFGGEANPEVLDQSFAIGSFEALAFEIYGEVGLGGSFELDINTAIVSNRHELALGQELTNNGLGDLELLFRWAPLSSRHAIAFIAGSRLSLYPDPSQSDLVRGAPRIGPGGTDILAGAEYGFTSDSGWFNLRLLHRIRVDGASTGVMFRSELGGRFFNTAYGALELEIQPAFGRDIDQPLGAPAPIPVRFSLGGKLWMPIAWGFGAGLDASYLPPVLNSGPGVRFGIGLTFESS